MATTVGTLLVNVIGNASGLMNSLNAAERTVERFGSRMFFLGNRITAGVTLPLAGVAAAIGKWGLEFDSAMTESIAIMDDVDAEMRTRMEKRAMDISENSKFTASEVAKAYYDLASAGFKAEESLDNIGTVATFAQAGLMQASEAGEFLAGAVNSVGLNMIGAADKTEAMARVADVLTKANNLALGTVKDFSAALTKQFGGAMKTYNISLEDGMALLMGYAENNIKGARASTLASMAVRDVQVSTIRATEAWKRYGISVFDAEGKLRTMPDVLDQILMRMKGFSKQQVIDFTTGKLDLDTAKPEGKAQSPMETTQMFKELGLPFRSITALQQLMKSESTKSMRIFAEELKNSTGTASEVAAKQMESMANRFAASFHKIQNAGIQLFNSFKPLMIELMDVISDVGDRLKEWADKFATLSPEMKKTIAEALLFVGMLGPALTLLGSWTLAISGLARAFSLLVAGVKLALTPLARVFGLTVMPGLASTAKGWALWGEILGRVGTFASNLLKFLGPIVLILDALRPAINYLVQKSGGWADVWSKLVGVLKGGWDWLQKWMTTLGNVMRVMSSLWQIVQFGWVQIAKLGEIIAHGLIAAGPAFIKALSDIAAAFGRLFARMWNAVTDFLGNIPIIGPVLSAAFAFIKTILGEFWNVVKTVFSLAIAMIQKFMGWLGTAISAAGRFVGSKIRGILPQELVLFFDIMQEQAGKVSDIHSYWAALADGMELFAAGIGAVDLKAKSLKITMQDLKTVMPRSGKPIDPNALGRLITAPGIFPDTEPPETKTPKRNPVQEAFEQLMGSGERDWKNTFKAFKEHRQEILANEDAVLRLRDAYMKVREEITQIPELEELFKTTIAEQNMARLAETMGEFNMDLHELQTSGMSFNDFVKKHSEEIERLSMRFTDQTPVVQHLINEYRRAQTELDTFERKTQRMIRSSDALNEAFQAQIEMTAKLADKEEELNQFRMTEGDKSLRGLQKNYEQMRLSFLQQVTKMVTDWQNAEPEYQASMERVVNQFMKDGMRMLEISRRLDLERVAANQVANDLIKRSFKNMTDDQLKHIIRLTYATRDWVGALQTVEDAIATLASTFDKAGEGWVSWLSKTVGLMRQTVQMGTDLRVSVEAMKAALGGGVGTAGENVQFDQNFGILLQQGEKDWLSFGAAAATAFAAIAQGISIIDQATSHVSKLQNVIGGFISGMQVGSEIGGLFGSIGKMIGGLLGGITGAIIGIFRGRTLRDIVRSGARDWGVEIGEELAKSIEQTMKDKNVSRQIAMALHFEDILSEAGGLSTENFDTFRDRLRDFFVFAANGLMPAQQAMEEYTRNFGVFADYLIDRGEDVATAFQEHIRTMRDLLHQGIIDARDVREFMAENFDKFAKSLEDSAHIAGRAWQDVINLIRDLGDQMPTNVREWLTGQTGKMGSQFAAAIGATTSTFAGLGEKRGEASKTLKETTAALKEAEDAVADTRKKMDEMAASGEDTSDVMDDLEEKIRDLEAAQRDYNQALTQVKDLEDQRQQHLAGSKQAMEDFGLIVLRGFNQATRDGLDWTDVMEQMGPALDKLVEGWGDLGEESENAAVKALLAMRQMYTAHKPLFDGISGLTQGMITLSRLGPDAFDQATFDAFQRRGLGMFRQMQAAVAETGGTHADALRPMIGYLQEMERAAKEYGLALDPATQELINQARELGLMKEPARTMPDIMADGFKDVTDAIHEMTESLQDTFNQIRDIITELGRIPGTIPIDVTPIVRNPTGPGETRPSPPPEERNFPVDQGGRIVPDDHFSTVVSPLSLQFHIETTQPINAETVQREVIPLIEQAGQRNQRGARTRLRNGAGI